MILRSKKGVEQFIIVGVIISILTTFVYFAFYSGLTTQLASATDDLACRSFVSVSSNNIVKAGEVLFGDITQRCKKDKKTISVQNEKQVYKDVANMMARCWYRYGEGQYDFLKNWNTEGNWCFSCAELSYDGQGEIYKYNDYIDWSKENNLTLQNGSSRPYYNYFNVKYSDINDEEIATIRNEYEELIRDDDPVLNGFKPIVAENFIYVQDLRSKVIDTNSKSYIVYRYDRPSESAGEELVDAFIGAGVGFAAGFVVTSILENALWFGISAVTCTGSAVATVGTGGLAVGSFSFCGLAVLKTLTKVADSTYDAAKSTAKMLRLNKLMSRLKNSVKLSRFATKIDDIDKLKDLLIKGSKLDIYKTADLLEASSDINKKELGTAFRSLGNVMDKLKLDNLDEAKRVQGFDKVLEKGLDQYKGEFAGIAKQINKNNIDSLRPALDKKGENIDNLIKTQEKLQDFFDGKKTLQETGVSDADISDYIRGSAAILSALAGGYSGTTLNGNYNQYVDYMTEEQYYRLCGPKAEEFVKI